MEADHRSYWKESRKQLSFWWLVELVFSCLHPIVKAVVTQEFLSALSYPFENADSPCGVGDFPPLVVNSRAFLPTGTSPLSTGLNLAHLEHPFLVVCFIMGGVGDLEDGTGELEVI